MSKTAKKLDSRALYVLAGVMLINALAYGTIIPLLYPYSQRFGINAFSLSLLFASFSLAQFIATPIMGRLSDRFGRKPLLLISLLGTSLSLALFASATNVFMLFAARILDGVTGGNISVAQAVIADSTEGKDRAKAFGVLGAAFGFGFLFGPALGGLLSQFGLTVPFWFAAALALLGTICGYFFLPETLKQRNSSEAKHEPFFDMGKLVQSLFSPSVGIIFLLTFLSAIIMNAWIIGFQSMTVDVLKLSTTSVGLLFTFSGFINIIMQAVGVRLLVNKVPKKRLIISGSFILSAIILSLGYFAQSYWPFIIVVFAHMIVAAPQAPVLTAMLTERTSEEDQGGVLGLNQSYTSLGQIIGPILAGVAASRSVPLVMLLAGAIATVTAISTIGLYGAKHKKFDL